MIARRTKAKYSKKIPPPPGADASYDELIAYHTKYSLDELERAGYTEEPSPEEIRELDESVEREIERQKAKGLAKGYPKTSRQRTAQFESVLNCLPKLKPGLRKEIANSLNVIADKGQDLEEICNRLLNEKHRPEEVAELLFALKQAVDYIRSYAENLLPHLVEIFDETKGFSSKCDTKAIDCASSSRKRKNSELKKRGIK